jgi:hypothetical protein
MAPDFPVHPGVSARAGRLARCHGDLGLQLILCFAAKATDSKWRHWRLRVKI